MVPSHRQELFYLPILHFWKTMFLLKIAIQGVSLWVFQVCMCYNFNWFMVSIFLFLPQSPSYGNFNTFKNSLFILV
jgi:hypothetical protein